MPSASVLNLPNERRMLDVVRSGLSWATQADIAVSFTRCSGLGLLIDPLRELVERKGNVRLLTSTYQTVTQPEALESLLRIKGLDCFLQDGATGFHSKFWLFNKRGAGECWAGSSNLSKGGLADNIEWNLRSKDLEIVQQTHHQFESLLRRSDVLPLSAAIIDAYAIRYAQRPELVLPLAADAPPRAPLPNAAQREALRRLSNLREAGLKRAAVIAATGIGKTFLAAFDAQQANAKSVLFVSHRLEHLTQARRSFGLVIPEVRAEFVTIQSLRSNPELLSEKWDYLVIDEFHHVEADGYRPLRKLRDNGHTFLLGLTATPERQDGRDILEWCDWNIAYEVRLPEAIERQWLLPFHYFAIADETIDFAKIPWRRGVFDNEALQRELQVERRVELILEQALSYGFDGPKRSTVGFCAGIEHAKYMAREFSKRGHAAEAVWGQHSVDEREAVYARLASPTDPLQWLFVADVLNEGVDIPAINSLMFLRPTESSSVFLQQLGRGLRLTPGCEVLTVLDFVGHHNRAWLALQSINSFTNTGAEVSVGDFVVKPPKSCEVVLQRQTLKMLERIRRHTTKRAACDETYEVLRNELGRAPLPIDLWQREGGASFADFRSAYGDWIGAQLANRDAPTWTEKLDEDHLVRRFLQSLEKDWQAQRVHAHAVIWGLASGEESAADAYEAFFRRFPQWLPEHDEFESTSALDTLEKKLAPGALTKAVQLAKSIRDIVGKDLLREVEGRILPVLNRYFEERHGGVLRTPADLELHRFYRRPEIIRYFGSQYDPARHNSGVIQFGETELVIITKLDTSGAKESQQYENQLVTPGLFKWTSQNRMTPENEAGRRVIDSLFRLVHTLKLRFLAT
jgi:superfamily II DNA or RNA helicase/HKD family nuclease